MVQNDHRTGVFEANRLFPAHEIITPETISVELVGQPDRPDLIDIIISEMKRRVTLKLSLGERVVLVAPALARREFRLVFAALATAQGASVIYVLPEGDQITDGVARAVPGKRLHVVLPMSADPLPTLRSRFRGVTIFGDVHGSIASMRDAVAWARSRNHFLWFLGDVIDCGAESLAAIVAVYNIVMRGEGAFILGNHERKIARWIVQQENGGYRQMKLSDGNRVTVNALNSLTRDQRIQWSGKFRSLLGRASLMNHLGDVTLVHAAVHPDVWNQNNLSDHQAIENYALYGEADSRLRSPSYGLSYQWIDAVPMGKTVFVGHDIRSTIAPMAITGLKGGRVIFLDTGAGKGGSLSTADVRFENNGELRLENFNRH
ncbi:unnamed protein product [Sphagnum tenellum]